MWRWRVLWSQLLATSFAALRSQFLASIVDDIFADVTARAGIAWSHENGESQDRFLIEATCGGVGFVDYNSDGLLDIYLVNGGKTPKGRSSGDVHNALYRNLGDGVFEESAEKAGVADSGFFGMGVAAVDYDNDGHQDLYLTGYPASTAWLDFDRDGWLDLFVCN